MCVNVRVLCHLCVVSLSTSYRADSAEVKHNASALCHTYTHTRAHAHAHSHSRAHTHTPWRGKGGSQLQNTSLRKAGCRPPHRSGNCCCHLACWCHKKIRSPVDAAAAALVAVSCPRKTTMLSPALRRPLRAVQETSSRRPCIHRQGRPWLSSDQGDVPGTSSDLRRWRQ